MSGAVTDCAVAAAYPWPVDEVAFDPSTRREIRALAVAAIREVSADVRVEPAGSGALVWGASHEVCAKAQMLAFDRLAIAYEWITAAEMKARLR